MKLSNVKNNYKGDVEQNPSEQPVSHPKALPDKQVAKKGLGDICAYEKADTKQSPSWHVNLPIKTKASVMMIQAQVLQNRGDEMTFSEVISEAVDFYHRHIFNL